MLTSIRSRLIVSHLTVIFVAMGLSAVLLLSLVEQYFMQATEESLRAQASITVQALIPGATVSGTPAVQQAALSNTLQRPSSGNLALQAQNLGQPKETGSPQTFDLGYLTDASLQLSSQLATRIRVVDARGTVLVDSEGERGRSLSDDPLVAQALHGQYGSRVGNGPGDPAAIMDVAQPVSLNGQTVGVVYLSQSLHDATAVLYDLRSRLLISTAVALLLSGLVGLLLAQAIARPIRRLTVASEAVAQGNFDQQVPAAGRDELGRLSRTFNAMTARLRTARQMQIDFVADVSHELRTPLTSIKGLVESLRDGAIDDPEVRDRFLATVDGETDRMIRLVNDLLTLSRADSGALGLRPERVDVGKLARELVAELQPQAGVRGVSIRVQVLAGEDADSGLPGFLACADPDRTRQVLANLLSNAIQYSHPDGEVLVSLARSGESWIQVSLQDDGIGIPEAVLPRIGERFYRSDRARSRAAGGSGLGLAIARALVQAHGGHLWIESIEGRGTTVSFTLPVA